MDKLGIQMNLKPIEQIKTMQNEWVRTFSKIRFPQGDKRKINKKLYDGDIESSYCSGALGLIEELHRENKKNPYATVEELFGDLQIIHVELFNKYAKKHGMKRTSLVEDLVINNGEA